MSGHPGNDPLAAGIGVRAGEERPDDTHTAYATYWSDGSFTPVIHRDRDLHEVWGDAPIAAATPQDMPAAFTARLVGTSWRIIGPWEPAPFWADPHRLKAPAR
jgi:hypothetical protein